MCEKLGPACLRSLGIAFEELGEKSVVARHCWGIIGP